MRDVLRLGLGWVAVVGASALACKRVQPVPEPAILPARPMVAAQDLLPGAPVSKPVVAGSVTPPVLSSAPAADTIVSKPVAHDSTRPELRRLLVSTAIKDKEPVPLVSLKVNDPVVAFLEVANSAPVESVVRVLFQHETGQEVGFVELSVPAKKTRWRTWAQTEMVRQPGKWTAIVRGANGEELGQLGFFVNPT
jgi:hypothetical protein